MCEWLIPSYWHNPAGPSDITQSYLWLVETETLQQFPPGTIHETNTKYYLYHTWTTLYGRACVRARGSVRVGERAWTSKVCGEWRRRGRAWTVFMRCDVIATTQQSHTGNRMTLYASVWHWQVGCCRSTDTLFIPSVRLTAVGVVSEWRHSPVIGTAQRHTAAGEKTGDHGLRFLFLPGYLSGRGRQDSEGRTHTVWRICVNTY